MSVVTYPCPGCGAPMRYAGKGEKLTCDFCGGTYDLSAVQSLQASDGTAGITFDASQQQFSQEEMAAIAGYVCQSCGAELMTESTTTATVCPYCGSAAVLPDQIAGGVKPELVIPFRVTKEQAIKTFQDYFAGKRLLPNIFLNSANRIAEMRQLYVPYWLFDCVATGDMTYDATRETVTREGEWEITRTEHYAVRRTGALSFDRIPVNGCQKMNVSITESLEPYDPSAAVPFSTAVLAGAMADRADTDASACEERAKERVKTSVESILYGTVEGYDTVSERGGTVKTKQGKATPVLMPVWLITTDKQENGVKKTYTFAINGQTGELTCDVPYDAGKAAGWFFGIFAAATAVGYGLLRLFMG